MRLIVTANQTPFIHGGANYLIEGVVRALRSAGHAVELLRFPFQFQPEASIERLMGFCEGLELSMPNGQQVDRVISLQFPGYGVRHPDHVVWLMHQHRAVYELYDEAGASASGRALRSQIHDYDCATLARASQRYTISTRVSERLLEYNGLASTALLHPPAFAEAFRCAPALPYVFYPSRLESLKRQDLLIEAARHLRSPVAILIAGDGGQRARYQTLIEEYGLQNRVRLLGQISEAEKIAFYAHALGVFFAPFDEDYGYITLEAMLSSKPVITCTDAGGPLAFVAEGKTGRVLPPAPEEIAAAIDRWYDNQAEAAAMGVAGRERYAELGISWDEVVTRLTGG